MEKITFTHIYIKKVQAGMGAANRIDGKALGYRNWNVTDKVQFSFQHSWGDKYDDSLQLTNQSEFLNLKYDSLLGAIETVFRRLFDELVTTIAASGGLQFDNTFHSVIGTPEDNTFNIATIDEP